MKIDTLQPAADPVSASPVELFGRSVRAAVLGASQEMARQAEGLRSEVERFLGEVRTG